MLSSNLGERGELDVVMEFDGHAHEGVAIEWGVPASGVWGADENPPEA